MKLFTLLLLLTASATTIAQEIYESAYVSDGKSFTIKLPNGNKHIGMIEEGTHLYSTDPNMTVDQMDAPKSNGYVIGMVTNDEGLTFEDIIEHPALFEDEGFDNSLELTTKKNHKFLLLDGNISLDEEEEMHIILASGLFDEVMVLVLYFDIENKMKSNPFKEMSALLESYTIVETDRENAFELDNYEEEYEEMTTFLNEGFETSLDFREIYFEEELREETEWMTDFNEDYPELLSAYVFETLQIDASDELDYLVQGGVKIFSGGDALNYQNVESKLAAIQEVFADYEIKGIGEGEAIDGTNYTFEKHKVMCPESKNVLNLYCVVYYDEMMFILAYSTENMLSEFESTYESFILGLNP